MFRPRLIISITILSCLFYYALPSQLLAGSDQSETSRINGTVVNESGQPLCAMVLANGQYRFTCSGDGSFNLSVPLDGNGQITVFGFCSGLAPYRRVIDPGQGENLQIVLRNELIEKHLNVSHYIESVSESSVRISGKVTYTQAERFTFFGNARMDSLSVFHHQLASSKGETLRVVDLTASSALDSVTHSLL